MKDAYIRKEKIQPKKKLKRFPREGKPRLANSSFPLEKLTILYNKFQSGNAVPSSGWLLYCKENKAEVLKTGVSGKNIAATLGQNWRQLGTEEKNNYKRKSYVLVNLNITPFKLVKSKSCNGKNVVCDTSDVLKRHKSAQ